MEVVDESGVLGWQPSVKALSVSCWFKISVPSGTNLTENMTILVNRRSGDENSNHAYHLRFNIFSGNIEFTARGSSGAYTNTLIERPYLDRWYHVAVVRSADHITGYADGRQVFSGTMAGVGDSGGPDGLTIGGWGNGNYLFGEVQEVAVHQFALSQLFIAQRMFQDQPTNDASINLKGYFKLAYSTNSADRLRNHAPAPLSPGTENGLVVGSGTVGFEETNQAGEQSAFDSRRNGGRDAIAPLSGAFSWEHTAFLRPTPGVAFELRMGYSSANAFGGFRLGSTDPFDAGPMGPGWRNTFETKLLPAHAFSPLSDLDTVGLMLWNGAIETWDLDFPSGNYETRSREYRGELTQVKASTFEWTTPDRLVYTFRSPGSGPAVMRGRLLSIRDFNTNTVKLHWNENTGVLTQAVDSVRGVYDFIYNAGGQLTRVAFSNAPGAWLIEFGYDSDNRLTSKSFNNTSGQYTNVNTAWQFGYNTNGLLNRIIDPRGFTNVFVEYDQYGRKTNQVDALGRASSTQYGKPGRRQMTHTDPASNNWVETYDRKGRILEQKDPLGFTTRHTYDARGNRTSITEPLGYTTQFGYDDRSNVIAETNALGEVRLWEFHPFFNKAVRRITSQPLSVNGQPYWTNYFDYDARGNLLRHSDDFGDLVRYTYTTNGLLRSVSDGNGRASTNAYDASGFLIAQTDAAGHTTSYAVNDVGWTLAVTNPLLQVTSHALDLNGRVVRTTDRLERVFFHTVDAMGNVTATTDGRGRTNFAWFDAVNQRTQTVDRAGFTNVFQYTSRGELEIVTNPLWFSTTNTYDAANRLISVKGPLGHSVSNTYDANGNLMFFHDAVGNRHAKGYDRLNRVIRESDPLGNTRRTTFDSAGRVKEVFTPKGDPSTHVYDGRGRLKVWRDAEGFDWEYDYDGVGNITNITDANGGRYVMEYGLRNERLSELNQDGQRWHYEYDALLRLTRQIDPDGITRNPVYDDAGRATSVWFSTGRTNSVSYDLNDNPLVATRVFQGSVTATRFEYDELDRPTNQVDALFQTVTYGWDALGRMTNLGYPGDRNLTQQFDALGRLTNQIDWAGRHCAYVYDRAGRMIRRTYPNGVVQSNTFDEVGRLAQLEYRTNATGFIALTYAYDRNSNKSFLTEKGTLAWRPPTLSDDATTFTAAGRLQSRAVREFAPAGAVTNEYVWSYEFDARGNLTNALRSGESYSLAYDEDNRTTEIVWLEGENTRRIQNRYDAMGRRIARTDNGATTGFVLSLVGGMERILCDLNPDATITYYVHGPDLSYREERDGSLVCFHSDAQANVIALTDANQSTVAQYAYTPYGRVLNSNETPPIAQRSQPYRFVGSQGVMEELPGLYFMRARYYLADAGVFLSTDPVKKIGPGWKPVAYVYANGNPLMFSDPKGEWAHVVAFTALGFAWSFGIDAAMQYGEHGWDGIDWKHATLVGGIGAGKGLVTSLAPGVGLAGDVGLDLLGSGIENLYEGNGFFENFTENLAVSVVGSGLGKAARGLFGNVIGNPRGRNVAVGRAFDNYFVNGVAGPNSIHTIRKEVAGSIVSKSIEKIVDLKASPLFEKSGSSPISGSRDVVSSSGGSLVGNASTADGYAFTANSIQAITPAPSFNMAGSTPATVSGGVSGRGGSSAFATDANSIATGANGASNAITRHVRDAAVTVNQTINTAVRAVRSFFGGFFGGRRSGGGRTP